MDQGFSAFKRQTVPYRCYTPQVVVSSLSHVVHVLYKCRCTVKYNSGSKAAQRSNGIPLILFSCCKLSLNVLTAFMAVLYADHATLSHDGITPSQQLFMASYDADTL